MDQISKLFLRLASVFLTFALAGCFLFEESKGEPKGKLSKEDIEFRVNLVQSEKLTFSLDDYKRLLSLDELEGGQLHCPDKQPNEVSYHSCEEFEKLRASGCYGMSTYSMGREHVYKESCSIISRVSKAKKSSASYIDTASKNWWHDIPASIIPPSGGDGPDDDWDAIVASHEKKLANKTLSDLSFEVVKVKEGYFKGKYNIHKSDCGLVWTELELSYSVPADYDQDGTEELLIVGHDIRRSDTCWFGSANGLSAGFYTFLEKDTKDSKVVPLKLVGKK